MKKYFFILSILLLFFHEILTDTHDCQNEYLDCFNCTTCGEREAYYENCLCQWNPNGGEQKCKSVDPDSKPRITFIYEAFSQCTDTSSSDIQKKYCGTKSITVNDDFSFSMPLVYDLYGTQSIYCEYNDTTTSGDLGSKLDKDFYNVKRVEIKLYFEHGFRKLPFSFTITKKTDNSKLALYITIGVIIVACILCALAIYCLSKKISENARLRQRAFI